jgi:uncharacterized protein YegL
LIKIPIVLCLDCSPSMSGLPKYGAPSLTNGAPVNHLNRGINLLINQIRSDPFLHSMCDIAMIGFSTYAQKLCSFSNVEDLVIPSLKLDMVYGGTSIGKAIDLSFEIIEKQLSSYANLGISATKPWLIFMTDGHPSDKTHELVSDKLHSWINADRIHCIPVGIGEMADIDFLSAFFLNQPIWSIDSVDLTDFLQKVLNDIRGKNSSILVYDAGNDLK